MAAINRLICTSLIKLIRLYQLVFGFLFYGACRFYPTCSDYAILALRQHGLTKGCWYVCSRLMRCHPFCAGGLDEVPK